jgi:hypothetical protein
MYTYSMVEISLAMGVRYRTYSVED